MKRRIRTTIQPNRVIEVEGPEYVDLTRQGLVLMVEVDDVDPHPPVYGHGWSAPDAGDETAHETPAAEHVAEENTSTTRSAARRAGTRNQEN